MMTVRKEKKHFMFGNANFFVLLKQNEILVMKQNEEKQKDHLTLTIKDQKDILFLFNVSVCSCASSGISMSSPS